MKKIFALTMIIAMTALNAQARPVCTAERMEALQSKINAAHAESKKFTEIANYLEDRIAEGDLDRTESETVQLLQMEARTKSIRALSGIVQTSEELVDCITQ